MSEASHAGLWHFYGRPTAFVGRVKELHRLREAMRNAIDDRRRQAALIVGPPGIGKSRLMAEFIDSLEDHVGPVTVISAACRPSGPPYMVFNSLLRQRFNVPADLPAAAAVVHLGAGLVAVFGDPAAAEEASHFIGHLVGLQLDDSPHIKRVNGDPRLVEERAMDWFARLLAADAQRQPLVICTEDLHHASDESLRLLLKLSEKIAAVPLLFLAGARTPDRPALRDFADRVGALGEIVELAPLSDRHGRRILDSLLSRADDVPASFAQLVLERAFGNPLSIEQIIELQIEREAIDIDGERWVINPDLLDDTRIPGTLRDVVRSKLDRLSPLERGLLEKAATIGERFWVGCLSMLRRVDEGHLWDDTDRFWTTERREEELQTAVEALRHRHILQRWAESDLPGTRAYQFKHSIEREVLYEGIEGPRRARYHRLIAQWLETRGVDRRDALVERIAHHWERGHHPRKAARYYIEAGERAFARHVNKEALGFLRAALSCLTDDDAADRLQVFHALARVHLVLGDNAEALGHLSEMLRLAWLLDDERHGGLAYNKMGRAYRALGEYDLAIAQLKNGLVLFRRVEDIRGIASCADDIGRVYLMRGDLQAAEERVREGLRLRRYLGDQRAVAFSLHHLGNIFTSRGDFKAAVPIMREALELARAEDDRRTAADVLTSTGAICYHRGEYDQALTLWNEALDTARTLGERRLEGMLHNNIGETLCTLGRTDEAREPLERAVELLAAVGDRRAHSDALRNLGTMYLKRGEYGQALEFTEQALEAAREVGALGQAGLAERSLAEVCSRTLYDDAPDREARIDSAAAHYAAAIRDLRKVGFEAELGWALLSHGSFLAEVGRVAEAKAQLERAYTLFERLGMKEALERTERIRSVL